MSTFPGCRGTDVGSRRFISFRKTILICVGSIGILSLQAKALDVGSFFKKIGYWRSITTTGALSARILMNSAYVNSKIFIWGGMDRGGTTAYGDGVLYDPSSDSYAAVTATGSPGARIMSVAISTGTKVIVWGGANLAANTYYNTGAIYDPVANSWTATSTGSNVPSVRGRPSAVWTGTKMLIWGGRDLSGALGTGAAYDPVANTWTTISTVGAPSARRHHASYWTGTKMIIWGGNNDSVVLNTGGIYDPATDTWTTMSTTNAPTGSIYPFHAFTGSKLIVWGGCDWANTVWYNTGAVYDIASNTWTAMSAVGAPSNRKAGDSFGIPNINGGGVWTGSRAIFWGGSVNTNGTYYNTGFYYDPAKDQWSPLPMANVPAARDGNVAIWTGSRFFIWGGFTSTSTATNTGAFFY